MNTIEKLYHINSFKKLNPENPTWLAVNIGDRVWINKMYRALEWMMIDEHTMASDHAQREFYSYFEPEQASIVKRVHEQLFKTSI